MKFDVYLDSGVSVEVESDPDYALDGEPYEALDHIDDFLALKAKAKAALITLIESDRFDLSYDRSPA